MNLRSLIALAAILGATQTTICSKARAEGRYGLASIADLPKIEAWVQGDAERYWIQGEKEVFYYDPGVEKAALPFGKGDWRPLLGQPFFLYGAGELPEESQELLRGGRIRLIESTLSQAMTFDGGLALKPLLKNHSLVESIARPQPSLSQNNQSPFNLGECIDAELWRKDVATLSEWNRYSYGSSIDLARVWLKEQFESLPGMTVSEFPFKMPSAEGVNVIARLEGSTRPDEIYIVGAHYDSTSEKPKVIAPGAEDNASGTAGLLALARVFAAHPPEATIIFVGFSGEEQGLYGSKAWMRKWIADKEEDKIKAILIMDMIGYSGDDELDLLLETSALTKPLLADIESAQTDAELVVSRSFDYWGSDHEPFLDNDIPAILFIENDYLNYPAYHRSTDTLDYIHPSLGPKILSLMANSLGLWVFEGKGVEPGVISPP